MTGEPFGSYDEAELWNAGTRLVQRLRAERMYFNGTHIGTAEWTEAIKDYFANKVRPDAVVDASRSKRGEGRGCMSLDERLAEIAGPRRESWGEFLFDVTHSTFPPYGSGYGKRDYWRRAFQPDDAPTLLLALESEMGKLGSPAANLKAVLEDASKLLSVVAKSKVVVFASNGRSDRERLTQQLTALMGCSHGVAGSSTGLWLDIPWGAAWTDEHQPTCWVNGKEASQ